MLLARLDQALVFLWFVLAKDRDYIFHGHDKQLIVRLKIDRNRVLGVEEDFVILPQWHILVMGYLATDGNDSPGNGGYFGRVGKSDSTFRFPFGFVFEDEHARSDRFDVLERGVFLRHKFGISRAKRGALRRKPELQAGKCQINGHSAGPQDDFVQNCDWFQRGCS